MKLKAILISALFALPGTSFAQVGATECKPSIMGDKLICEPTMEERMRQQGRDLDAFMADVPTRRPNPPATYSWRDVPPRPCSRIDRLAYSETPSYCSARELATTRKAIGELVGAGKCDDALKAALGTGDIQFAGEVRAFCAAPAK